MIELHCHTTYSDGTLTPTDLVHTALKAGVKALAITDHDTIAGWDEALAAARPHDLTIVPGIELSTTLNGRSLHILGFYPDPARLQPYLHDALAQRQQRASKMVARLADLGYPIELPLAPPNSAPGRTHIATAMVRAGHVTSATEAFDQFLTDGAPAYIPSPRLSPQAGIHLLLDCGAVPVWAHPFLFKGGEVETVLPLLVAAGLKGVEAYHPAHTPEQTQQLMAWAERDSLIVTGGSDYHGPQIDPRGKHSPRLNTFHLPLSMLSPIQHHAQVDS